MYEGRLPNFSVHNLRGLGVRDAHQAAFFGKVVDFPYYSLGARLKRKLWLVDIPVTC